MDGFKVKRLDIPWALHLHNNVVLFADALKEKSHLKEFNIGQAITFSLEEEIYK